MKVQKQKMSKQQWKRRNRLKRMLRMSLMTMLGLLIIITSIMLINEIIDTSGNRLNHYSKEELVLDGVEIREGIKVKAMLLTPNEYSRPETKLKRINGIVVHYVGNPGTTAKNNRNYFEQLKETKTTSASSHFVVGLKGEIIQCIPMNEVAYASNHRNDDTISIEVCHPDASGEFNEKTYQSVIQLIAHLCKMFDLESEDVIRHYDVTQKKCPLYYVDHEDAWEQLKLDVKTEVAQMKKKQKNNKG